MCCDVTTLSHICCCAAEGTMEGGSGKGSMFGINKLGVRRPVYQSDNKDGVGHLLKGGLPHGGGG